MQALHAEPSHAGIHVGPESALHSSTVYACTRVLSESVASLPLYLYKRDGDRTRKAEEHPLYHLLNARPNRLQTSYEFRALMMTWLCIHGNAYAEIVRDKSGTITAVWPLAPPRMILRFDIETGQLQYSFAMPGGPVHNLLSDNVLHIRALSTDGLIGHSPIFSGRETIGLDLTETRFAASYFGTGARIGGIISHPETLNEDGIRNLQDSFKRMYTGVSQWNEVLVLEENMKYQEAKFQPDQAQFLESRRYSSEEICRLFRVPPPLIGLLDKTNNSITEQLTREFVTQVIRPWLVNFEQSYATKLLRPEEQGTYYMSHDLNDVLRGDPAQRWDGYMKAIQMGVLSPNDVRRLEHLDPRDNGDIYLQPTNLAPSPWSPTAPQKEAQQ